jgi:hypothetical protein
LIAQLYWGDVDCLEMRGKPLITNWTKMKQELQEKYLPRFYRNKLLDQWNNIKQGTKYVNERCPLKTSHKL